MDDVVDTSDPEELLELHRPQPSPRRPSKRPKLHHVQSDSDGTPARFVSPSEHTSPSLTNASSPRPSTPLATPPDEDPDVVMQPVQDFIENTQDPLLLASPKHSRPLGSSSPATRSPSPPKPIAAQPNTPARRQRDRSESVDPLLLFTPSRPSANDRPAELPAGRDEFRASLEPPSPLTPPPPEASPAHARRQGSVSPSRSLHEPHGVEDLGDMSIGRYSLRQRQAKQLRPYQFDKVEYKKTMRYNPDAIIKVRSPQRRAAREENYEEEGESQETQNLDGYEAENDDDGQNGRRASPLRTSMGRGHNSPEDVHRYLQPMSEDEGDESLKNLSKEARKHARELKKRQATVKSGRKRLKPFPLKPSGNSSEEEPSRKPRSPRSFSPSNVNARSPERILEKPPSHRASSTLRTSGPSSPLPQGPVSRDVRSFSPPAFMQDNSDIGIEGAGSAHFEGHRRSSPIVISEEEEEESDAWNVAHQTVEEPQELSKKEKRLRKQLRALSRMVPAIMRDKMMKDVARPKTTTRHEASDSEEDQPLLPGQARVRRAKGPHDLRDVVGDPESSDEEIQAAGDISMGENDGLDAGDPEVEIIAHRRKTPSYDNDSESSVSQEDDLSDGCIDAERIDAYLKEPPLRGSGLQDRDMIDWMLANTAEVGGTRQPRKRVHSKITSRLQGLRRPQVSVLTRGARKYGRERQTLLSFDKAAAQSRSNDRPKDRDIVAPAPRVKRKRSPMRQMRFSFEGAGAPISPRHERDSPSYSDVEHHAADDPFLSRLEDEEAPMSPRTRQPMEKVYHVPPPDVLRKGAKGQKAKERRAQIKMNGVHVFLAPEGNRIVGQRNKNTTANVADRGPHRALAPLNTDRRRQSRLHSTSKSRMPKETMAKPKRRANPSSGRQRRSRVVAESLSPDRVAENGTENAEESEDPDLGTEEQGGSEEEGFLLDFDIPLLPAGVKFGSQTYTGRGYLSELVNPPEVDATPLPAFFSAQGFDLGPKVTAPEFLAIFDRLCDRFFDFAIGLPEEDNDEQTKEWQGLTHVTCRLVTLLLIAGEDPETLKAAVETQVLRLTSKLREASLNSFSMDSTTFALCWFTVELAIRAGFRLPASKPAQPNALSEACTVLVEQLLEYGLERVMEPLVFHEPLDGSTASHRALETMVGLWHVAYKFQESVSASLHPLWKMVETSMHRRGLAKTLKASESVWRAIISICTVSQFSASGAVLVQWAENKSIPRTGWDLVHFALTQTFDAKDESVDTVVRDRYIQLLVERCCLLWSRWQWDFRYALKALLRLVPIFQHLQFSNLQHENTEFPDFLRLNDWTLLSRPIHSETAFVLFLKLVYQTLLADPSNARKLMSGTTPSGSLSWTAAKHPSRHELSKLQNRFGVIAVALHVEPERHIRYIELARGYARFKDVDLNTRVVQIRGFMYLAIVMVERKIPLDEPLRWLEEMAQVLLDEHRQQPKQDALVLIILLVRCVRKIIDAFKGDPPDVLHRYPNPKLLLSLDRIFRDQSWVAANTRSAYAIPELVWAFLSVRASYAPQPKRPPLPAPPLEQESQDEYGMFDQDFLDAFEKEASLVEEECKENDKSLCNLLEVTHWTLFRRLREYVAAVEGWEKKTREGDDYFSTDMSTLTECWVGCGSILIQNTGKTWDTFLHAYRTSFRLDLRSFCQHRMDFLVYSNVLKQDPMSYLTFPDTFIEVLFEAFASWHTTSEDDYIKLLLSIDGCQHPLFRDVAWDADEGRDGTSNLKLLEARLPLITKILNNLSESVGPQNYIKYCIKMFAAMKSVYSELKDSKASQRDYTGWCLQVFGEFQKHANLVEQDHLQQYKAWARRLRDGVS